jgi:predicted NAD-dependent protein-ADP-ribosyltransferase YbiA (DUF1768 family)
VKFKLSFLLAIIFLSTINTSFASYPTEWWSPIPREQAASWEILPQDAKTGEVILSKRNELGVFSNLAFAPFTLDEELYNSVEGLWQGMKYPDPNLSNDPRMAISPWPHTRKEVYLMSSWDSKTAGNEANDIYKKNNLTLVNFKDHQFIVRDGGTGSDFHYALITRAILAKVNQNPKIKELLLKTKGLILKADHVVSENEQASYRYDKILMKIRDEIK